jgi:hypothetical protein
MVITYLHVEAVEVPRVRIVAAGEDGLVNLERSPTYIPPHPKARRHPTTWTRAACSGHGVGWGERQPAGHTGGA